MITEQKIELLRAYDFVVGDRDPKLNTAHAGAFMVAEQYTPRLTMTKDAGNGPWCIVGDDLIALVDEAYEHLDSQL